MAEVMTLKAEKREKSGTRSARKIREKGLLPAIVYGHQEEPVSIVLDYHDLSLELQHRHRLLEVELDGKKERLLVKEVQYDHLGDKVIHVDLARVALDERVEVTVAVELKGTPKGAADGGVVEQMLADVELECLVTNIPERIRVSIADLEIGKVITAGDLVLPEGTKLVTEASTPVVTLRVLAEEMEEETAVGEEGEVEPEVITAREKEEESSEEKGK